MESKSQKRQKSHLFVPGKAETRILCHLWLSEVDDFLPPPPKGIYSNMLSEIFDCHKMGGARAVVSGK